MYALRVVFDNVVLCSRIPDSRLLTLPMALRAERRNIDGKRLRLLISPITDSVRAVTIGTGWRILVAAFGELSVCARGIEGICLSVADSAVHPRRDGRARPFTGLMCRSRMTLGARHFGSVVD